MKVRNGFVSNSSSSSFIVHESSLSKEQIKKLIIYLYDLERVYEAGGSYIDWSGDGFNYIVENGFFIIGDWYISDEERKEIIDIIGKDVYTNRTYRMEG